MSVTKEKWSAANGMVLYTLRTGKFYAKVTNFGAVLVDFGHEDAGSMILGSDDPEFYIGKCGSIGATVGRFANRINAGRFTLDGKEIQLNCNEGSNHLHGGFAGFEKHFWAAEEQGESEILFSYISPDGEEHFPGTLVAKVMYSLLEDGTLKITYNAKTTKKTILNLTNHTYFNLGQKDILGCKVTIPADRFVETGAGSIPTGRLADVTGTVMDLRGGVVLGDRMADEYLKPTRGYDHCFCLTNEHEPDFRTHLAAVVEAPNGVTLECRTDLPGVQLYCGCMLDASPLYGRTGLLNQYAGLCLETQFFPDSPNQPSFPSCVLEPGSTFTSMTTYKLTV